MRKIDGFVKGKIAAFLRDLLHEIVLTCRSPRSMLYHMGDHACKRRNSATIILKTGRGYAAENHVFQE